MQDWCRWCRPSLFVPLLALLALAGMAGACGTVQSDVRARASAALEAAGVATVTVEEVSYRNVTLTGPADLEAEAIGLIEGLEASHEVTYVPVGAPSVTPGISPTETTVLESTGTTAALAPIDLTGAIADGSITLTGSVPDDPARTTVVAAAESGFATVIDRLTVAGSESTPEQAAAVADLATVLGGPAASLSTGEVRLVDQGLTVTGTAATPEGVTAINGAIEALTGVTANVSVGAEPGQAVLAITDLVALDPITFESGSDVITPESEKTLLTAIEYLMAAFAGDTGLVVELGGHTDDQGDEAFNLDLSQRRASAVVQFLTDNGVPATGLVAAGYGEAEPVADNTTPEGRAENRRIEFTIVEG